MTEINDFMTDTHRRVAAQCSRPRSATEIADYLRRHDPNTDASAHSSAGVAEYLADLEADGLVKNVGTFEDGESAVAAQNADPDVIDFCGDPEVFASGARNPLGYPFLDREDHFVFTPKCHAKLTGPSPVSIAAGAVPNPAEGE